MKKTSKILIIISAFSVLILVFIFQFKNGGFVTEDIKEQTAQTETQTGTKAETEKPVNLGTVESGSWVTYQNQDHSFSFKYPADFKVVSNQLDNLQEIITAEKDAQTGFQIFIMPFDEPGTLTPERIRQDIPDMVIENLANSKIDTEQALIFHSNSEDLGDTFEVWFVSKGKLYQVSARKAVENLVKEILLTWVFK